MNNIIYHDNCNDGFMAAFLMTLVLKTRGEDYRLIPMQYGDDLRPLDKSKAGGGRVYIVDFYYSLTR